jgi:predicted nucleic acid-binding protein
VAIHFFDSSAIVKRYVSETGTAWVLSLVDPTVGNHSYLARITGVEVVSAVARQRRDGNLSAAGAATVLAQFRHDFSTEYRVVEITPTLILTAMTLAETHALRSYDAVQLAAAVEVNNLCFTLGVVLTLISGDAALNAAAMAEGLAVEDPNSHP